jgi:hypothetical protein
MTLKRCRHLEVHHALLMVISVLGVRGYTKNKKGDNTSLNKKGVTLSHSPGYVLNMLFHIISYRL